MTRARSPASSDPESSSGSGATSSDSRSSGARSSSDPDMGVSSAGSGADLDGKRVDITSAEFLKDLIGQLDKKLGDINLSKTEAVRDKLNMRARLNTLKGSFQESRDALAEILKEKQVLEGELATILKEQRTLEQLHVEAKQGLLHVRGQLGTSKAQWDELQKHNEAVHQEQQHLHDQRSSIHNELCALRARLTGFKTQTMSLQKDLCKSINEKRRLENCCKNSERTTNSLQSKIEDAEIDREQTQARYTELKKWIVHLEGRLGEIDRERSLLRDKAGAAAHEVSRHEGVLGKKSQENKVLRGSLNRKEEQNRILQKQATLTEKQQEKLLHQLSETEMARQELHTRMSGAVLVADAQFSNMDVVFGGSGMVVKPRSPSPSTSPSQQVDFANGASDRGDRSPDRQEASFAAEDKIIQQKSRTVSFEGSLLPEEEDPLPSKTVLFRRQDGIEPDRSSDRAEASSSGSYESSRSSRSSVTDSCSDSGASETEELDRRVKAKAKPQARLRGGEYNSSSSGRS